MNEVRLGPKPFSNTNLRGTPSPATLKFVTSPKQRLAKSVTVGLKSVNETMPLIGPAKLGTIRTNIPSPGIHPGAKRESQGAPMPTYVNPDKCDGCGALGRPACIYICPMDPMKLEPAIGKGFNREPDPRWESYSRVKSRPNGAIETRGYADVIPMAAALKPVRGTYSIIWTTKHRDGRVKRFKPQIRTTPWGSIEPFPDDARPDNRDLKSTARFGESKYLGVDRLPTPGTA